MAHKRKANENILLFHEMIYRLNLNRTSGLNIIDIGSKAGLFPFFCQCYGHHALACDLPEIQKKAPDRDLLDLLNVKMLPLKIEPFVKFPTIKHRFDLITGFRTRFHSWYPFETGKDHEDHWGRDEWNFFLEDLSLNYLTKNGRIYFLLGRLQEKEKGERFPLSMRRFFKKLGGCFHYNVLSFKNSDLQSQFSSKQGRNI